MRKIKISIEQSATILEETGLLHGIAFDNDGNEKVFYETNDGKLKVCHASQITFMDSTEDKPSNSFQKRLIEAEEREVRRQVQISELEREVIQKTDELFAANNELQAFDDLKTQTEKLLHALEDAIAFIDTPLGSLTQASISMLDNARMELTLYKNSLNPVPTPTSSDDDFPF